MQAYAVYRSGDALLKEAMCARQDLPWWHYARENLINRLATDCQSRNRRSQGASGPHPQRRHGDSRHDRRAFAPSEWSRSGCLFCYENPDPSIVQGKNPELELGFSFRRFRLRPADRRPSRNNSQIALRSVLCLSNSSQQSEYLTKE